VFARAIVLGAPLTDVTHVDLALEGLVYEVNGAIVATNTAAIDAAVLMERLMDEAARALAIDPVVLRRRNVIPSAASIHRSANQGLGLPSRSIRTNPSSSIFLTVCWIPA